MSISLEDLTRELELRDARIHRLLYALDGLERLVTRVGGFATMDMQEAMRDARAALEGEGVFRKPKGKEWVNRG